MVRYIVPIVCVMFGLGCSDVDKNGSVQQGDGLVERFEQLYENTQQAYEEQRFDSYRDLSRQVLSYSPKHPRFLYSYARGLALAGNEREALQSLSALVDLGGIAILNAETDTAFQMLAGKSEFQEILQRAKGTLAPVHRAEVAFTLKQRDLIPEGVAYDSLKRVLYISSIYRRKIVFIREDGTIGDFVKEKQDGLFSVVGMEVDESRRTLWVCSGWYQTDNILDITRDSVTYSSVYKYDIDRRKLLKKYELKNVEQSFLNDLTINSQGDVFITDTKSGDVYQISHERDTLELFASQFMYPNGITISDDGKDLFVADLKGVTRINLQTRESQQLLSGEHVTLMQADGLAYYKNSLIAHQSTTLGGVFRYYLDEARGHVIRKEAIESHNPLFDFPTTGEIAGDAYFFIANAQLRRFQADGSIYPYEKLSDVYIMKAELSD